MIFDLVTNYWLIDHWLLILNLVMETNPIDLLSVKLPITNLVANLVID